MYYNVCLIHKCQRPCYTCYLEKEEQRETKYELKRDKVKKFVESL